MLFSVWFQTDLGAFAYYVNNEASYALLAYDYLKVWRHSFQAQYKIYNIDTE